MKKQIIVGNWDGVPITRDETPEETLARELGVDKVEAANLFIKLTDNANEIS